MKQPKIHRIWNPAMECMDREKLRELQSERLRETVRLEYENVPLYRSRMDAMGVKPEDIKTVDDLKKLPFTEKTDLRDEFPYGLLAAKLTDIVRIQGSSGTTGKPIVTGYTQNDIDDDDDRARRYDALLYAFLCDIPRRDLKGSRSS